jgi:xylan 1,4-beta-xylosidase
VAARAVVHPASNPDLVERSHAAQRDSGSAKRQRQPGLAFLPLPHLRPILRSVWLLWFLARGFAADPANAAVDRTAHVQAENQPRADRDDGTFRNPVLAGHYHDPSVVRVGADYYLTHCPDLIMWHSRDLVNWRPIGRVDHGIKGDIWAPELIHHQGLFYLYLPVRLTGEGTSLRFTNVVLTARDPAGPWSAPVDLKIGGIDPGHVAGTDGTRWLYVNQGRVVQLASDGLRVAGESRQVYTGWPIPDDWIVECHCLESPKLFRRGEWYYLVSAQGGTAGPSTSHMVVVARSKSPIGPWENDPRSPLLRTAKRSEPWWSQGHGTLIDAPDGSWWMLFHAIENSRRNLGRETLLLPITWTPDGWPRVPEGVHPDSVQRKPAGENVGHGLPLSDDFTSPTLGLQWRSGAARIRTDDGALVLSGGGASILDATRTSLTPVNASFEITVEVELAGAAEAGLALTGAEGNNGNTAAALRANGTVTSYVRGRGERGTSPFEGPRAHLRIRNVDQDIALFVSRDGATWRKFPWGSEISGNGVIRIALYATGGGEARFRRFSYRGL